MSENPYAASLVEQERIASPVPPLPQEATAREVFVAWEKLRLLFNGTLAAVTLLGAVTGMGALDNQVWVLSAISFNVLFCVGPVCEGYLTLIGITRRAARVFLFGGGTIAACAMTVAKIVEAHNLSP
ncbi:MAG TPA: hypothetical protein VL096_17280 [Pirellulaceae bacterium]|nr:hypothetical protein [Pirellulaceae bacterium]